jgi:hypothetical protein
MAGKKWTMTDARKKYYQSRKKKSGKSEYGTVFQKQYSSLIKKNGPALKKTFAQIAHRVAATKVAKSKVASAASRVKSVRASMARTKARLRKLQRRLG